MIPIILHIFSMIIYQISMLSDCWQETYHLFSLFYYCNATVNPACKRLVLQDNIPREEVCNFFMVIILDGS
jgi:hypothetical protein